MRAYHGTTLDGLRAIVAAGGLDDPVLHAVTPALREAAGGGDDEELEFLAACAAADDALAALAASGEPGPWRRVVVALELDDAAAGQGSAVLPRGTVPWRAAVCVLVDDTAPEVDAVLREAASSGDSAAADDLDLQWYALQEVDRLLAGA